jgi:hypothetical protein
MLVFEAWGVAGVSQWCHRSVHVCYSGVTVVLQWCYSGVTVVLQWCYRGAPVMEVPEACQGCYSDVTVVSLSCHCGVTVVLQWSFCLGATVLSQQGGAGRQQTTGSRHQTADNRQQTADSRQQTADTRQQTADSRQGPWCCLCPAICSTQLVTMASSVSNAPYTVVIQWCYNGVTVVLQLGHRGVTEVLQWCYSGVTMALQFVTIASSVSSAPYTVLESSGYGVGG